MKTFILLCFLGSSLWILSVSAHSDEINPLVPIIKIGADGCLPTDGSQCVQVDADGVARVNFVSPPHKKNQEENGFEYDRSGFYLSLVSADRGSFQKQSSFLPSEASIYQEIISSENAGKTICFKLDSEVPVPSYFEAVARYFGLIGALRNLEASVGASYQHFPDTSYPGSIPALTMLYNQLEMGRDMRHLMELNTGASSAVAGVTSAGIISSGYLFFPDSWYTPITELSTAGSFTLFYSAPIGDGLLIGIDDGFVTPYIGEQISPANGTDRQPGSLLASHAFRGPAMLASLYGSQNYWSGPNTEKRLNRLMVSLTIVTTHSTRTFIRELSSKFLDNGELLGYIQDGLLMITIASTEDPSNVISIYFDENLKGRTHEFIGSYNHHTANMKTVDSYSAYALSLMERTLMWAPVFAGLLVAYPYTAPLAGQVLSSVEATLASSVPMIVLIGMNKARSFKRGMSKGMAKAGNALAKLPGISHAARLRPKTTGSGIPFQPKNSVGKAMGLSFSFNVVGPGFRSMVRYLSNLMTDLCDPGSVWHQTFQTGRQFVIGHYVLP